MFAPRVSKAQTKTGASSTAQLVHQRSALVPQRQSKDAVEQEHMLQRTLGNQATLRLFTQRASCLTGDESGEHHEQEVDFTRIHGISARFQFLLLNG
jgi:hypothetical protein